MAVTDTLRLLLNTETPDNIETIETSMREITTRLDLIDHRLPLYHQAHHRIDQLLAARHQLLELDEHDDTAPPGGSPTTTPG